jgi:hypothetical protein
VKLTRGNEHHDARVIGVDEQSVEPVRDSPIDCPEYICFFWCEPFSGGVSADDKGILSKLSFHFRQVVIDDGSGESDGKRFIDALNALKGRNPTVFMRSLGFVLTVKRNRRSLLTYNWDPKVLSE